MSRIIVNVIDDLGKIPNLDQLLPQEFAVGGKLKEQGILEHLFVKDDRTGAVLVLKDVDLDKAKELVATFPLSKYFDQVEYIIADKQF
jgi:hypothetical protein